MEIWKAVSEKGFEDRFEISNQGRLRNAVTGRIKKPREHNQGYYQYNLTKAKQKTVYRLAHVLVAKAFIPNPENKRTVNHKDSNKKNNFDWNLEWATHGENHLHAFKNGRLNPNAFELGVNKLTREDVVFIRTNYLSGDKVFGGNPLAKRFNISYPCILKVIRRISYKSVE